MTTGESFGGHGLPEQYTFVSRVRHFIKENVGVGRLKESIMASTAPGGLRRGGYTRVTSAHPCQLCDRSTLCSVRNHDGALICTRIEEGCIARGSNDLGDYYIHMVGRSVAPTVRSAFPSLGMKAECAPPEDLDRAYRLLVARSPLLDIDRNALRARGFSEGDIKASGYGSLVERGRAAVARAIVEAVGEELAQRVPGIVQRKSEDGSGRVWLSVAGWSGLLIPVRDKAGLIVAMKVRRRGACEGNRYSYLSSLSHGGASPGTPLHVPLAARMLRGRTDIPLVITEGPLKADVACVLAPHVLPPGLAVVSVPGVKLWRRAGAVEFAKAWGAPSVLVAYDADACENVDVADAAEDLRNALEQSGIRVGVMQWPVALGKGLDDYLWRVIQTRMGRGRHGP